MKKLAYWREILKHDFLHTLRLFRSITTSVSDLKSYITLRHPGSYQNGLKLGLRISIYGYKLVTIFL
jgi:hypothetical protein